MLKISVITACFNSEKTIEDTIKSVVEQDYQNIEYIIVDGKSTDNTLEIVHQYKEKITIVHSEKDNGIYDALNRGIGLANGDIIAFLHSDDVYASPTVISKVMAIFQKNKTDSVYGDLQYVERENSNNVKRYWKAGSYKQGLFLNGWMPPHPSFFLKKESYLKFGMFNTSLKTSADYELMLRMLHKNKLSTTYLPEVLVKMRVGGQSNVSFKNRIKANKEDRKAWELNGLNPSIFTTILKPLRKLSQFINW